MKNYIEYTQEPVYLEYFKNVTDILAKRIFNKEKLGKITDTDEVHAIALNHLQDQLNAKIAANAILNFVDINQY